MTLSVKHPFHSAKADGVDSTLVKPTDWNADHTLTTDQSVPIVLGRTSPGPGAVSDIPVSVLFPTGAVIPYAGATAPTGWLLCYGQSLLQADYSALYAVILQTYGAGPGPATFLLPDLRGTTIGGKSNMGGADRGNLPGGAVLGQYLGVNTSTASVSGAGWAVTSGTVTVHNTGIAGQVISAVESMDGPDISESVGGGQGGPSSFASTGHRHANIVSRASNIQAYLASNAVSGSGGSVVVSTVQPTVMLNYIIKY